MTTLTFGAQFLLLLIVPVGVGFWFAQRLKLPWRLFFGGALAFIASWIITNFIPLPWQLSYLASAILQTIALYLFRPRARRPPGAVGQVRRHDPALQGIG